MVDAASRTDRERTGETGSRTSMVPLLALCLGLVVVIMDATVVNTALPSIGHGLHASVSGLQWVLDGYTLVFAGTLLSAGSFGDKLGARRVFLSGLVVFTLSSLAVPAATPASLASMDIGSARPSSRASNIADRVGWPISSAGRTKLASTPFMPRR